MAPRKCCASRKWAITLLIIGIFILLASVVVLACFPMIFKMILYKELALVNNTMVYNMWRDLPIPIDEYVYYYNITNAEEFLANKEKLNVSQVGPYVYSATWKKHNIQWHPNNTITYQELRTYQFSPNKSSGSEDDEIYSLNGPLIMAANFLKDSSIPIKAGASLFFSFEGEKVIIKKSIKELTYSGYHDPIIKDGSFLMPGIPFKNGLFAWLYGKNATYDGQFTVFTGEDDIKKVNIINNWNGMEKLPFWKDDTCNAMNGSSVETNPPLVEDQTEITFFQSFFCRSLTFTYNNSNSAVKGIPTKRFYATDKVLANRTYNPDNSCFQTRPFLRTGLQDVGPCQFGAPAFLSFPRFFLADDYYADAINGLENDNDDYRSYVDIEPNTGLSINIKLGFQLNLEMTRIPYLLPLTDVPEGFFPVLWVRLHVTVTDELADTLHTGLYLYKTITYSVLGVLIAISLGLIVFALIRLKRNKDSVNDTKEDQRSTSPNGQVRPVSSGTSQQVTAAAHSTSYDEVEEARKRWLKQKLQVSPDTDPSIDIAHDELLINRPN